MIPNIQKVENSFEFVKQFASAVGISLTNIEDAIVTLKGIELLNIFDTTQGISQKLIDNYKQQIIPQILNLLGSLNIIGNPIKLFSNVSTGVKDFIQKPIQGLVQGPIEAGMGLGYGATSLLKNVMCGTFNSIDKIAGSFSNGITHLCIDDDFIQQRHEKKSKKPKDAFEGIEQSLICIYNGVKSGVIDTVQKPIQGSKENGIKGFIKGTWQGISGVIIKPVSGILDAISKTAEGFKNTAMYFDSKPNDQRLRQIRVFYEYEQFFQEYNEIDSEIKMGNFIQQLKSSIPSQPLKNPLTNTALSKLREYHGSFKSVCDTFAIEQSEFDQILGQPDKSDKLFSIWDTDKNGLIDALELFSGLIIFSDGKFEDKLRFLFDIFDFNELNSLSIIDLEFMMISCCNAAFKMYGVDSEVNEEEISDFLGKHFNDDSRVNISQMLKWCAKVDEINQFMNAIDKQLPESKNSKQQQVGNMLFDDKKGRFEVKSLGQIINSKKYQQKIDWLSALSKKLFYLNRSNTNSTSQKDTYCKINWVYGFRSQDVNHPIEYIRPNNNQKSERILYFTACIVVIFYPQVIFYFQKKRYQYKYFQIKVQQHYLEHDREVICLAVSKKNRLVASGELGDKPHIHVWDPDTLQNLGVIKGIHQKGISFITFFRDDEFIASCGLRLDSPILIYSVKDYTLTLSTFVEEPTIELLTIRNYIGSFEKLDKKSNQNYKTITKKDYQNSFIVVTSRKILMLHYQNGHFQQAEISLNTRENSQISEITCAAAVRMNNNQPYLKAFQQQSEACIVLITGHVDGSVYMWWNMDQDQKESMYKNQNAILCIITYQYGIIIATEASTIHFWDLNMKINIKNIDLTTFAFKLFNYNIADILIADDKLLVSTTYGDIIEIKLNQKQEWTSNKFIQKMHANRLNFITKLNGNLNAMCILERPENDDKILFVAGQSGVVYGFSLETHEIVDIWTIGQEKPITAMDCVNFEDGGTVFAVGCNNGHIYMRIDWEESPRSYDCKQMIMDLKFSSDTYYLIAACQDCQVYLFSLSNNSYFQVNPKKLQLEEVPISIDFLDDNKSFLIGTNMRNQYKVELPDLKSKNIQQENEKINCTIWNMRYPLHTKNYADSLLPIIIGGDIKVMKKNQQKNIYKKKVFLAAGESGYLFFWRDHEQLESNCGGFLKGHASQISRLLMTKSQDIFFSLGSQDNTIIEWQVDFINDYNDFSKPFQEEKNFLPSSQLTENKVAQIKDDVLIRELAYSYIGKNNYISDAFRDTFLLFRGTNQKTLNLHLQNQIPNLQDQNHLHKRPPQASLELDFIYGFQAFDKRRTLYYAHIYYDKNYKEQDNNNINVSKKKKGKKFDREDILKKLSKHRNILAYQQNKSVCLTSADQGVSNELNYDQSHDNCERNFVYFTSRVGIVYNPAKNKQIFYEGHKSKITCMVVQQLKFIVATGEAASKPSIHIWNVLNCEPLKILPTFHKNGIVTIAFSQNSSIIVSIGMDINFSIQVTNWKTEEIIALRNSGQYHIFDVCFNPYNKYELVTCGTQNITVWELNGRNLLRKLVVNASNESVHGANCCITCVDYLSYWLNEKIETDIIAANNYGDLILITCNKYIPVKERAHSKMINCIKIFTAFEEYVLIITAGEDELIKIWDTKFNQINEISTKKLAQFDYFTKNKTLQEMKNLSAQSIDVYFCNMRQQKNNLNNKKSTSQALKSISKSNKIDEQQKKQWPTILIGTRNGSILEATFELDQSVLKKASSDDYHTKPGAIIRVNTLNLQFQNTQASIVVNNKIHKQKLIYMKTFLIKKQKTKNKQKYLFIKQKKQIYFTLHPEEPIMVTVGEDGNLFMFDIKTNKSLIQQFLSKTPSAIKFSPDGSLLVIGFVCGTIRIFDSKISKNKMGKLAEKYEPPSLDCLNIMNDGKTAVLNIQFTQKGDFMAASFDNSRQSKEFESKFEKEGSYISIYTNRASHKNKGRNEKNTYQKLIDIRCPSVYESYRTDSNAYGCAVYFMTFSKDEDFLLIYYQLVDNYLVRINHDQQGHYMVWDIKNNQAVKLWDSIKSIQWQIFNFPNSLVAQYQYYSQLLIPDEGFGNTQQGSSSNNNNQLVGHNTQPPYMSVMLSSGNTLICGSIKGDLHLVKQQCLYSDKDFQNQQNKPNYMCLAKSYSAHVSFVNQCENSPGTFEYLFTSGITDECVMKWKLKSEEQLWDLDNINHRLDQPDIFAELVTKDKFNNLINEVLPQRGEIAEVCSQIEDTKESSIELQLSNAIGRKAYNRYNNLFYDYDENILYIAGCNLVVFKGDQFDDQNQKTVPAFKNNFTDDEQFLTLKQEFIKLDASQNSTFPQISCFSLSDNKKFLVAGTVEIQAKILIWDICSRTCIRTMRLTNSPMILKAKFAHNNRHICVVALTNDYTMCVYLVDSGAPQILGCCNFPYTLPYKIKDLSFLPNSINKFITCGIQHMSLWKFNGSILSFQPLEIENPKDKENVKNNADFVRDDGNKDEFPEKDQEQQNEEEDDEQELRATFLCIIFVQDVIITSAEDGFLYVWEGNKIIQKQLAHQKIPITSLFAKKESNLFVSGGLDGRVNLWEIIPSEYNYIINKVQEYSITNLPVSEAVKSAEYNIQSVCIGQKYILVGTKSGDIYELMLPQYTEEEANKLNIQNELEQNQQYAEKQQQSDDEEYEQQQQQQQVNVQKQQKQQQINLRLNCHDQEIPRSLLLCSIDNLSTSVEFVDFTIDNSYLLYKDNFEEVSIIDLTNHKKINTIYIEHDVEWCSDGIKISEKTKGVHSYYNDENKILKITPIKNCIAVTDEMGTIRIFNYPCESGTGNGYMMCYPDHLNNINQCVLSPNGQFLVTSSERDRCIFIWTVKQNLNDEEEEEDYYQNNDNNDENIRADSVQKTRTKNQNNLSKN
ncbi:PH domain protein [Ichthyophthirius multifiliis]|uniref:PH domain protein n=1 Tax=Ichthyophthirius multifiliis TaxID=5932 RepID=G0QZ32_ICHMU|nr:PH domain protein [Ichthyophthirius multifiliis]EGR29518.1 PH domain protein [Ichthyophthirius multifiliis]|eukprot:XP_004030754.1 PH domain protein [Ichthyophthirius multifiliis]